jgi:hypothetical protein
MKIELIDVVCRDTEDVTGADEFYLVGALAGGTVVKPILTKPIDINDDQRKTFPAGESVLFEGDVPQGQSVKGGIKAYDEDAGKDWSDYHTRVLEITTAVVAVVSRMGPLAATAAAILAAAIVGASITVSSDKDDLLGSTELEISTTGPAFEERSWLMMEEGFGWSTWDYIVRYRITRS